jgi:hypothetical protein
LQNVQGNYKSLYQRRISRVVGSISTCHAFLVIVTSKALWRSGLKLDAAAAAFSAAVAEPHDTPGAAAAAAATDFDIISLYLRDEHEFK